MFCYRKSVNHEGFPSTVLKPGSQCDSYPAIPSNTSQQLAVEGCRRGTEVFLLECQRVGCTWVDPEISLVVGGKHVFMGL